LLADGDCEAFDFLSAPIGNPLPSMNHSAASATNSEWAWFENAQPGRRSGGVRPGGKRRGKTAGANMSILSMRLGMAAFVLLLSASSGQAVTCQEVRGLSATELGYWAERLQVTPTYLAKLLDEAFCKLGSRDEPAIVPNYKSRPPKAL
jgi:hypothetical protein